MGGARTGRDRGPGGGAEQGEAKAAGQMCAARVQTACDAWAGPCQGHAPRALTASHQSLSPTGAGCCRAKAAGAIWAALHEARGAAGCSAGSQQQAARGPVHQDSAAQPAAAHAHAIPVQLRGRDGESDTDNEKEEGGRRAAWLRHAHTRHLGRLGAGHAGPHSRQQPLPDLRFDRPCAHLACRDERPREYTRQGPLQHPRRATSRLLP